MTINELINKLEICRSWKEAGVSVNDVIEVLKEKNTNFNENDEIQKLKKKIERLSESNKQLRNELKKLKGE